VLPRALAVVVCAVLAAGLLAALGEAYAARSDDSRFPVPGELVSTGTGALHVTCTGVGAPTVLLESGLGEPSLTWADVQARLDNTFTVCSYDRAGYGWSRDGTGEWEAGAAADQAATALERLGHPGPYVVVAHSLGALVARELHQTHPGDVSGLVLVDPTNEQALARVGTPAPALLERHVLEQLARTGVLRVLGDRLIPAMAGSPPPGDLLRQAPALYHPGAIAASRRELRGAPDSAAHLLATEDTDWADVPVIVISAATATQKDRDHHATLARRSTSGRHVLARSGGHYVHYDDPALVVNAVCDVAAESSPRRC
jgi:pimeloyl-ACP methyl ester carboxylesterase